jgi:hypothetical protein
VLHLNLGVAGNPHPKLPKSLTTAKGTNGQRYGSDVWLIVKRVENRSDMLRYSQSC